MILQNIALWSGWILKAFSIYFIMISLFCFRRPKSFQHAAPATKFAVLIAARNEEQVIAGLIESLLRQDYPRELFDIFVIPNNCADRTEERARSAGASIIRADASVHSKGDALRCAFRELLPEDFDAYVIFDADNIADPGFLSAMNDAFSAGAAVCKSRVEVKNPYTSWVSGCYGLYFSMFNWFFNAPRSSLGLSSKLIGTGMGISRDVLLRAGGWNTETIAEDTEFHADCAIRGDHVAWVPGAVAYDEAPGSFLVSLIQRKRWVSGVMQVSARKLPSLAAVLMKRPSLQTLDSVMILFAPYLQLLSLLPAAALTVCAFLSGTVTSAVHGVLLTAAVSYIVTVLFAVILAGKAGFTDSRIRTSVVMYPVFTVSWFILVIASAFSRTTQWRAIRHSGSADQ